ncbi:protease [Massilia eurypsychrophila]|uniref:Protease n=1 Tax=Massilia eurypsychrophila TaxID=1485217 RepID=A0A2G8TLX0_9BURK|nr:peptidoglycan DD-metalloendopeptidase family protein [Massilia eurypsychrophila]PIL47045.1 protease [Massilia eurypsychrophila]
MKKQAGRAVLAFCLTALVLAANGAHGAAKPTERSKQKASAEATRAGIQQKLSTLKRDISRTESEKENAADTLAESEEAISDANRALRDLAAEQGGTNARLGELETAQEKLAATIAAQKKQLARLLREHYKAGNEDRIKLLLSGDNPNRINRDLQLMAYVSQAQARLLAALRGNLLAVETNREQTQNAKDELEEIAAEQQQQKTVLEKEKIRRAALLSSVSSKLAVQRKEVGNLERDEQRLAGLVDKLTRLIQEQAEAAAAEQRRLAVVAAARARADAEAKALAAARKKAERERLAREAAARPKPKPGEPKPAFKPDPIDADEPKVAAKPATPVPDPAAARPADIALAPTGTDGAFASLRGQLRPPVAGRVAAKFGAKREGVTWKGVFIKAVAGAEVSALADGRVVYAGWQRGMGNLIVVSHGSNYLAVYANNETLLKSVGAAVKAGDPIATVGNTGGNEESGLYFEIRHMAKPLDPASWIKF